MKKAVLIVAVLGIAAAVAVLLRVGGSGPVQSDLDEQKSEVRMIADRAGTNRHSVAEKPDVSVGAKPKPVLAFSDDADGDDDRSPEEKALAEKIEAALDEESLPAAIECAKAAMECPNADVRHAMVETLGWFGAKGLPELTPFLADSDAGVRESAMNEWSMALADIDDEAQKISTVEMAMSVLGDEEALEDISGEYIGVDEKLAVESLVRIIEGEGSEKGIEKAKETYEFVTGEEYTGRADAERWIAEEYQP